MSQENAEVLKHLQYAMWVDEGAVCAQCGRPYKSVDDFIKREVRAGHGFQSGDASDRFVDEDCWDDYVAAVNARAVRNERLRGRAGA